MCLASGAYRSYVGFTLNARGAAPQRDIRAPNPWSTLILVPLKVWNRILRLQNLFFDIAEGTVPERNKGASESAHRAVKAIISEALLTPLTYLHGTTRSSRKMTPDPTQIPRQKQR